MKQCCQQKTKKKKNEILIKYKSHSHLSIRIMMKGEEKKEKKNELINTRRTTIIKYVKK